jgi:hypothetical protein
MVFTCTDDLSPPKTLALHLRPSGSATPPVHDGFLIHLNLGFLGTAVYDIIGICIIFISKFLHHKEPTEI